jgi:hypothetical protein
VRTARIALLAAMAGSGAMLLWYGRGTTFTEDDLTYYARLVHSGFVYLQYDHLNLEYVFAPHETHLQATGRLIYEGLFATAGAQYGWYRVVAVAGVLLCVWLFFELAHVRVGPWAALAPSLLLLVCGYAWEVLLWPFDLHTTYSLAAGLGALICLERPGRRREAAACGLLVLSVATIELGLAFVAAAAVLLVTTRRYSRLWIAAVPAVLYLGWYIWAEKFDQIALTPRVTNPIDVAQSIGEASGAVIGSLLALNPTKGAGEVFVVGDVGWPVLSVLLVVALAVQIRRGPNRPFLWAAITLIATYWLLLSVAGRPPDSSRYIFPGAVGLLLVAAEALHARRLSPLVVGVLFLTLAVALPKNIQMLEAGRDTKLAESDVNRIEAGAMQLVPGADPNFVPATDPLIVSRGGGSVVPISVGQYRSGAARVGPYGLSPDQLLDLPAPSRDLADAVLARAGGLRLGEAPKAQGRSCRRIVPVAPGSPVEFPIPPAGVTVTAASSAPIPVRARLFGPTGVPVSAPLAPGRRIAFLPSVSGTTRLWSGLADGPIEVCRLQ